MTRRLLCVVAATMFLVVCVEARQEAVASGGHNRKVRPDGIAASRLLMQGMQQSATIRSLIAGLDGSDVIVVLQVGQLERSTRDGQTSLIASPPGWRYLRVVISGAVSERRALEMLGHELQHVTEIAAACTVRTEAELMNHFKRIGIQVRSGAFETEQANEVEGRIRLELAALRTRNR